MKFFGFEISCASCDTKKEVKYTGVIVANDSKEAIEKIERDFTTYNSLTIYPLSKKSNDILFCDAPSLDTLIRDISRRKT